MGRRGAVGAYIIAVPTGVRLRVIADPPLLAGGLSDDAMATEKLNGAGPFKSAKRGEGLAPRFWRQSGKSKSLVRPESEGETPGGRSIALASS